MCRAIRQKTRPGSFEKPGLAIFILSGCSLSGTP